MKRPQSLTFIGIAGLVLGSFGITNSAQGVLMPWVFEFWERIIRSLPSDGQQTPGSPNPAATEFMREFLGTMSPSTSRFVITMSFIGLVTCAAYVLASIRLLMMGRHAVGLLSWAIIMSDVVAGARVVCLLSARGMMLLGMVPGTLVGITLDLVLLVMVLTVARAAVCKAEGAPVPPVVEPLK